MNRTKAFWMAVVLALIAGPLAAWLTTTAYAQTGILHGSVMGPTGKPLAGATLIIKSADGSKTFDVKTDNSGSYSAAGLLGGVYNIDLEVSGHVVYSTSLKI